MFTRRRLVGKVYKKETDWGVVAGVVFWGFIILTVVGSCAS